MRCGEVMNVLPGFADDDLPAEAAEHIDTCLRCQAEATHYRKLGRALANIRSQYAVPPEGLTLDILAAIDASQERRAAARRRGALVGLGGLALAAAGTVVGAAVVRSRHRNAAKIAASLAG